MIFDIAESSSTTKIYMEFIEFYNYVLTLNISIMF